MMFKVFSCCYYEEDEEEEDDDDDDPESADSVEESHEACSDNSASRVSALEYFFLSAFIFSSRMLS